MDIRLRAIVFFLLASGLSLVGTSAAHAAESYDNCSGTISSLPAVITTQGTWCMKQDLTTAVTSGNAITVNTSNVTIDCNYFKLGNLAAGINTLTAGVNEVSRLNVTVRHCNIRGFFEGLNFNGGTGHVIEDNRFDNNTYLAINISAEDSVVRRNQVFDTGNSPLAISAAGINASLTSNGGAIDILDNTISGVLTASGSSNPAYGIRTDGNGSGRIVGNAVRGVTPDGAGAATGIRNDTSGRLAIRDNDISGTGIFGSVGLRCSTTSSRARDNTINGFVTGLDSCGDAGGNDITP